MSTLRRPQDVNRGRHPLAIALVVEDRLASLNDSRSRLVECFDDRGGIDMGHELRRRSRLRLLPGRVFQRQNGRKPCGKRPYSRQAICPLFRRGTYSWKSRQPFRMTNGRSAALFNDCTECGRGRTVKLKDAVDRMSVARNNSN